MKELIATLVIMSPLIFMFLAYLYFHTYDNYKSNKNKKLKNMNELKECSKCKKLSREYQRNLYSVSNDKENDNYCPHCERHGKFQTYIYDSNEFCILTEVKNEDKWMITHPDCPKIDYKQVKMIDKTIEQIKKSKLEMEEQKRFEKYNNIKVDSEWINNLTKTMKKIQEENTL